MVVGGLDIVHKIAHSILISSRNFFLLALLVSLSISCQIVEAESLPPGDFSNAQTVTGDDTRVCSTYINKNKVGFYLSQIDGQKLLGKPFWTSTTVKKKLSDLGLVIKSLSKKSDKKSKAKLAQAKKDKAKFLTAKKQLLECVIRQNVLGQDPPVQFSHVKGLIQNQCMNCHGVLGWQNTEEFYRDSGRIVPGQLEASPFYTFLSNNPERYAPANMPKGLPPLSDMNLQLLSRWISNASATITPPATPTPGGVIGEGRDLYQHNCASCHGAIDISSKYGRTASQISAALGPGGIPEMRSIHLTQDQISKIALALASVNPPVEGTLSVHSLGSVTEGNPGSPSHMLQFEIVLSGHSSQPFTIGYVTSNGNALAGSDYVFTMGTLQFAGTQGERKVVNVEIIPDSIPEVDESVSLNIGGLSYGGVRVNTSTSSGAILNDDTFVQNPPPAAGQVRMAYTFNSDFKDSLRISDAVRQGNAAITSSAKVGSGALELLQAGDYLSIPGQNLQGAQDFSVGAWVYWQNTTSTTTRIFDFGSSSSIYIYFTPRDSSNRCRFEMRGSGTSAFTLQCLTNVTLPANQWVYLTTTFNSSTDEMKIYFNGVQVANRTGVTLALSSIAYTDSRIGRSRVAGSVDYVGRVDEFMVWDSALNVDQIATSMAMTSSATLTSGMEVRLNGQVVQNGSTLDLGSTETGAALDFSLFVQNNGPASLSFVNQPIVQVVGANANAFLVDLQPMSWQQMLLNGGLTSFALRYTPSSSGSKNATLVISNSDQQNGNFAVALVAQATGDPLPEPAPPAPGDSAFQRGQYQYAINCASCHGILASSQKRGASLERITNALSPNTGVPQMQGLGLTTDQIADIVIALNSPLPESPDDEGVRDSVVNVGTAPYVASVLTDIFLPDSSIPFNADDTLIKSFITEGILGVRSNGTFISGRVRFFQSPAQRFDTSFQNEQLNNVVRPVPDTVRAGLLNRACNLITDKDRAIENALGKIGLSLVSPLTPQSVKDIYEKLFAPGKVLPQYLADVVSTFPRGAPGFTNTDMWRFVLNLYCRSGVTEVL